MFQLRDYQIDSSNTAVKRLTTTSNPFLLVLATGAGKSIIIADICDQIKKPVLVLQPSKELLLQNLAKMQSYNINVTVYSASVGQKNIGDRVVMATIGSVYRHPKLFEHFEYVVIDEADVVDPVKKSGMYYKFLSKVKPKNVVGLTATPYRMHTEYERENFELYAYNCLKIVTDIGNPSFWTGGIAFKIETHELIQRKYLSSVRYRPDSEELRGLVLNSNKTDYTEESVEAWGNTKVDKLADYVGYVDQKCQRNLVFCTSVLQAEKLKAKLQFRGIRSAIVTAKTPAQERDQLVADFRAGKIKHMLNCSVFLAGFDVPELDCIIFAKPTLSPRIWYQAIGRGLRLDPARPQKILRVFDLAGALKRIGPVETIRVASAGVGGGHTLFSSVGRLDSKKLYRYKINKFKRGKK